MDSMLIVPMEWTDLEELHRFQPADWSDIRSTFSYYISSPFCNPVKAVSNGEIIGVGASISYEDTGWLAHIIVCPRRRKQGIGTALVNYLCDFLIGTGRQTILLIATEMGLSVYKKAGFREQEEYVFMERKAGGKVDCDIDRNIAPLEKEDLEGVLALDRFVTGEGRQELLKDYFKGGFVYKAGSQVLGYYLKDLEEGLIIAIDARVGQSLMELRSLFTNRAALPVSNDFGVEFYKNKGFVARKVVTKMIKGGDMNWQPSKIFNRAGGNFG